MANIVTEDEGISPPQMGGAQGGAANVLAAREARKNTKYADTKQLKLLAAATFLHFPDIKKVKAGLLFVVAKDFIKEDYDVETTYDLFAPFHPIVDQLAACHENNVWNPKRNFTCKNWCPVLECSHNGKR